VHALANAPVKKGDLLLEIHPEPFQYTLNQAQSQLQAAKENVKQAGAGLEAAQASVAKSKAGIIQAQAGVDQAVAGLANTQAANRRATAQADLAKTEEQIAVNLQKTDAGAISELKVTQAKQQYAAELAEVKQTEAGVSEAEAVQRQADAGLAVAQTDQQLAEAAARQAAFALEMTKSNVAAVEAQLDDAKFNLSQCKMVAPADGFVVNWQVQEGTMLVSAPLSPAGTFINTSETHIAASFPQNHLVHVKPDDDVELVLDP
jgi:multidrug resistance efflux pump